MRYPKLFIIHSERFEPFNLMDKPVKLEPLVSATKEDIQSAMRYMATEDKEIDIHDVDAICKKMIELFKNSKCYNEKTESERQEIIAYLDVHPEIIELYTLDLTDDDFNF